MSLSDDFTEVRRKVNTEITDERVIAHCHTCINQLDDKTKEAIKELKMRFNEWNEKMFRLETIELLIDEILGKELSSGVEE